MSLHSVDAVVPLYNESLQSILITLNSLNAQTYRIDQIIFVDDASTCPPDYDAAARASRIPVRILRFQSNVGISAARNHGARNSNADFLLFVDSEIELFPLWTTKVVNFLANHQEVGLACGSIASREATLCARWRKQFFGNKETWIDQTHEISWTPAQAVLVQSRYLWQVGGWDERLKRAAEDGDFCQRLRQAGLKIYQVEGALGVRHEHFTVHVLAAKSIRGLGWSLDPEFPGDAFVRPLRFLPALSDFLKLSVFRMARNVLRFRWALLPVDLGVICCGVCLTIHGAWRRAFFTSLKPNRRHFEKVNDLR
jgi:glycosyltransferase involved in cell wall biosynthesis